MRYYADAEKGGRAAMYYAEYIKDRFVSVVVKERKRRP